MSCIKRARNLSALSNFLVVLTSDASKGPPPNRKYLEPSTQLACDMTICQQ